MCRSIHIHKITKQKSRQIFNVKEEAQARKKKRENNVSLVFVFVLFQIVFQLTFCQNK